MQSGSYIQVVCDTRVVGAVRTFSNIEIEPGHNILWGCRASTELILSEAEGLSMTRIGARRSVILEIIATGQPGCNVELLTRKGMRVTGVDALSPDQDLFWIVLKHVV